MVPRRMASQGLQTRLAERQKAVHRQQQTWRSELIHNMHADVRSLECSLWWVVLAHGMWGGGNVFIQHIY